MNCHVGLIFRSVIETSCILSDFVLLMFGVNSDPVVSLVSFSGCEVCVNFQLIPSGKLAYLKSSIKVAVLHCVVWMLKF